MRPLEAAEDGEREPSLRSAMQDGTYTGARQVAKTILCTKKTRYMPYKHPDRVEERRKRLYNIGLCYAAISDN
jgi:hypothetical protein